MSNATVELFARELGGAGKPPLVLLHGLLGSGRNWQTAGAGLAEAAGGQNVWALDLRNHGKSPWHNLMTYEAMVADVLAWLDARGLGEVDLMGHSMGGKVAMALACRHPIPMVGQPPDGRQLMGVWCRRLTFVAGRLGHECLRAVVCVLDFQRRCSAGRQQPAAPTDAQLCVGRQRTASTP